jgi:hypothetical protein
MVPHELNCSRYFQVRIKVHILEKLYVVDISTNEELLHSYR